MKKQTNNTFEGGLLLDTHPLTTPNNVLTDALNATLITMNGNEGILQNDMGNGRVESAFLPPGYVPVGMKEYGGIIYVASYNPVTNKSQIGSFPSPERNIDQTETGSPGNYLNLLNKPYDRIFKYDIFNQINPGIGGFTNKIQIFDKVIRSGDKFGLYFDGHDNNKNKTDCLSNYFNYNKTTNRGDWDSENNVYKNDIITLSVQVLDANNNLRDITPQLKRYDNNNELINFDDEISEQDKFNSGYFISNTDITETSSVDVERNKKALNTYNNKLFGKLFLTGVVNVIDHIESYVRFKTEIKEQNGETIEEKIIEFNVNYYYNCKENYLYPPKIIYRFNDRGVEHAFRKKKDNSDITYDPITNLYKKEYIIEIKYNPEEDKTFNYAIVPTMQNLPGTTSNQPGCEIDSNNKIISKLVHIATEGYIDLEKVGKGFEKINEWRYRYLGDYMQLNLGLEYYPLEDDKLSNLKLTFINIGDGTNTFEYIFPNKISYNGTFTTYLNFGNDLKYGQVYKVEVRIKENNADKKLGERILISTEIYNDLFTQIYDYCDENNLNLISEKNKVVLDLNIEELAYSNSGLKDGSAINLIYNDNSYTGTGATQFSMFGNGDNKLHGIIKQYDTTVNQNIKVSFDIPSKFPFKFSNIDQINYNLQVKAETTKPVLKSGTYDLPILDKQYNVPIKSVINGQNDVYTEQTLTGEKVCNIETKYFFYSELAYKYNSSKSPVIPRYIYKDVKKYIKEQLNGKDFIVPVVRHTDVNSDTDNKSLNLLKCTCGTGPRALYDNKPENMSVEIIDNSVEGSLTESLIDYKPKINKWLETAGMQDQIFCVVGSPILFGWCPNSEISIDNNGNMSGRINYGDVVDYINDTQLRYDEGGEGLEINFCLKDKYIDYQLQDRESYSGINVYSKLFQSWQYWAALLWKDKNNNFVIVNNIIIPTISVTRWKDPNQKEEVNDIITSEVKKYDYDLLVDQIFNSIGNIYFKQTNNDQKSFSVWKLNDNITYIPEYTAEAYNTFSLINVQLTNDIDEDNKLFTLGNFSNGELSISIDNNELDKFLKFNITNSSNEYKSKTFPYIIPSININKDYLNCSILEYEEGKYLSNDIYQSELSDNFYKLNGINIYPIESMISYEREFLNRLTIKDNELLVNSKSGPKNSKYAMSATSGPGTNNTRAFHLIISGNYIDFICNESNCKKLFNI